MKNNQHLLNFKRKDIGTIELGYLENVPSVTWKVYISMSLLHGKVTQPVGSHLQAYEVVYIVQE